MTYIKVYTETPIDEKYPLSLANSVHFAISEDGQTYEALHSGFGILFAEADISEKNTIIERGVTAPRIKEADGEYYIWADRVDKDGKKLCPAEAVIWKTADFLSFSEQICVPKEELTKYIPAVNDTEVYCSQRPEATAADAVGGECQTRSQDLTEATVGDVVSVEVCAPEINVPEADGGVAETVGRTALIDDKTVAGIRNFWFPVHGVKTALPENISVDSLHEVRNVLAEVVYSDGSFDAKKVIWDYDNPQQVSEHQYRIKGHMEPVDTGFPLAVGYADPVIYQYDGSWYFLATNDNVDDIGLFVRKAESIPELFEENTEEFCILPYDESKGFCQTFWAPEFHLVGEELYIFFAVSGSAWGPQCYMMKLKKGGEICNAADWEEPAKVVKPDGTSVGADGISLDMTYIPAKSGSYVCWSYRQHIGTPDDTGSMLYIARVNEEKPWQLISEPVLLSRPLYGWENNSGTINNEGPYALITDEKVYLAYSGGAACGYSYAVGYLIAGSGEDLLDVCNWRKLSTAMFSSASIEGIEGPGHNSFFEDEDGKWYIAYHAQDLKVHHKRCTAYHRVHFLTDGFPMLNVSGERDIAPHLQNVEMTVTCRE